MTGIGAPYGLLLPVDEGEMVRLERTIPVRYTRLEDKHRSGEPCEAEVVSLSAFGAILRTLRPASVHGEVPPAPGQP